MTRENLLDIHQVLCSKAAALMDRKNKDYGGENDCMKNLRLHGRFGISVRLHDKVCRLESASKRELAVTDESAIDTVIDIINYAVLWVAVEQDKV